ncbi:hypothetical protein QBC35DRAFT_374757 [Podospora australis]|uniref:PSI domain-containing protein n=1 Tax=Podospora australis TaxID=1536484 RepID=A0AAN7ALN2_9PEZI|nr:hypothetical protein QBC35DRAFT_374757 [Podospora australis]
MPGDGSGTGIVKTTDDPWLHLKCWRQHSCGGCLNEELCSWCPYTQACVPNTYPIPLLAPAYDKDICPHWSERWELRTRPFGCAVSTRTSLSVGIAVVSTVVFIALLFAFVALLRWSLRGCCGQRRRRRRSSPWLVIWDRSERDDQGRAAREDDPLLGHR